MLLLFGIIDHLRCSNKPQTFIFDKAYSYMFFGVILQYSSKTHEGGVVRRMFLVPWHFQLFLSNFKGTMLNWSLHTLPFIIPQLLQGGIERRRQRRWTVCPTCSDSGNNVTTGNTMLLYGPIMGFAVFVVLMCRRRCMKASAFEKGLRRHTA